MKFSVTRTCGAGRHTRRMASELVCTLEYLGSCTGACTEKYCCLPFMAVRFSPRALALSSPTVQLSPPPPLSGHLSPTHTCSSSHLTHFRPENQRANSTRSKCALKLSVLKYFNFGRKFSINVYFLI